MGSQTDVEWLSNYAIEYRNSCDMYNYKNHAKVWQNASDYIMGCSLNRMCIIDT